MGKFLTIKEASAYFTEKGIPLKPDTLRKKVQKKEVPYYDLGRPMFKVADLERFIESKRQKAERWPKRR